MQRSDLSSAIPAGAIAGFVATIPMTVAMGLMHRELPWWERYQLPPGQIVSKVTQQIGLRKHIDRPEHVALTALSHFAYGAAAGAIYIPLANYVKAPPVLKGILIGLIVWTTSYLGLLPVLGILRPATEHPPRRTALMIVAHIVWGIVLGIVADRIQSRQQSDEVP